MAIEGGATADGRAARDMLHILGVLVFRRTAKTQPNVCPGAAGDGSLAALSSQAEM